MTLGLAAEAQARVAHPGTDRDEDLHQVRLVLKRLRSLLRLFRPVMEPSVYDQENQRLRSVANRLASFRDATVIQSILSGQLALAMDAHERRELKALQQRIGLDARLASAARPSALEPALAEAARDIRGVCEHLAAMTLDRGGWTAVEPGLRDAYRKARRGMERARKDGRPESFHEWRKALKHLLHHARFLQPVWPKRRRRWMQKLDRLQNTAGQANDLDLLKSRLTALIQGGILKTSATDIFEHLEREHRRLRCKGLKLGRTLLAQTAGLFTREARRCWKTWRRR